MKKPKPRKRPAKRLSAAQKAEIAVERLAGVKEPEVARRHQVAKRTVRAAVQAAREAAPEDFEAAGRAIVARVLERVDRVLDKGLARLEAASMAELKPAELSRVLSDVARIRRDVAGTGTPGEGQHPAERKAVEEQPTLERESPEQWNARHAIYQAAPRGATQ